MTNEPNDVQHSTSVSDSQPSDKLAMPEIVELPAENIQVGEFCERSSDDDDIGKMAASMKHLGLLQPLIVMVDNAGNYVLIAGRRRLLAARKLGWKTVRCQILEVSVERGACMSWAENAERRPLTPLEQANSIRRMLEQLKMSETRIGEEINLPQSTVHERISILDLPPDIQKLIGTTITYSHAVLLARLMEKQLLGREGIVRKLLGKIQAGGISTTELRTVVKYITDDQLRGLPPMLQELLQTHPLMNFAMLSFYEQPEALVEGEGKRAEHLRVVASQVPKPDRAAFIEQCVARGKSYGDALKLWQKRIEELVKHADETRDHTASTTDRLFDTLSDLLEGIETLKYEKSALRGLDRRRMEQLKCQVERIVSGMADFVDSVDALDREAKLSTGGANEKEATHAPVGQN